MSAVVKRLGVITPEVVVSRRASCSALNLTAQFLEASSSASHRRRASVGPSEASSLCPATPSGKHYERRSLCPPDFENSQPSVAYLSRKRASLDNTWLTQWILPNDALAKQSAVLTESTDNTLTKFCQQGIQNDQEEFLLRNQSVLFSPTSLVSDPHNFISSNNEKATKSFSNLSRLSPTHLSPNSHHQCGFLKHRTTHLSPSGQALDKTPNDPSKDTAFVSPYIIPSPHAISFNDCVIDGSFTPHLSSGSNSPKYLTRYAFQHLFGLDHSPRQGPQQQQCYNSAGLHGPTDICSPKILKQDYHLARTGHRKRSSPSIVFPSLSPCIEDKTKTNHFAFDLSRRRGSKRLGDQEVYHGVSPGRDRRCHMDAGGIPEIHVDVVDSVDADAYLSRNERGDHAAVSSAVSFAGWCQESDQVSPCLHCYRRRHSLEMQSCNICKRDKNSTPSSRPSTPQPWQLQYHFLHHHRMLHIPGLAKIRRSVGTTTVRDAKLAFKNLCLQSIGSVIGRGGFGIVKLGCYRGIRVAVKVLKGERASASALREAHALKIQPHVHLNSTHAVITPAACKGFARISWAVHKKDHQEEILPIDTVASLFGLSAKDASYPTQKDYDEFSRSLRWTWVVSELCSPSTLLTLINDPTIMLTAREKVRFTGEIASGLSYLHSQGLVHLDVKPANVLLSQTGHLRLADYGCCAYLNDDGDQHVLGTVNYQAPEVLRGEGGTCRSDVFSLGVTSWHLLTLTPPYHGLHPHIILYQVTRQCYRPSDHYPVLPGDYTLLEQLLSSVAERCWAEDPNQRPSAAELSANLAALYLSPAS